MSKASRNADILANLGSLVGLARIRPAAAAPATRAAISSRGLAVAGPAPRSSISPGALAAVLKVVNKRRSAPAAVARVGSNPDPRRFAHLAGLTLPAAAPLPEDSAIAEAAALSPSAIAKSWDRAMAPHVAGDAPAIEPALAAARRAANARAQFSPDAVTEAKSMSSAEIAASWDLATAPFRPQARARGRAASLAAPSSPAAIAASWDHAMAPYRPNARE